MGKNEEKWLRNGDFFRFSNIVTLISFIIAYWTYWQNLKSIGPLKFDLYGLLYFHIFNIRISREENAKWKKEQFIRKKWKSFCSIDLKVYKHLHTYKTQLHTKFGRILNSLSGILDGFSGILHNLEIFWQHGRIRLLWKTLNSCKIRTSYPIAPIFWLVTYLSDPKIPTNFLPLTISGSTITAGGWFPPRPPRHVNL